MSPLRRRRAAASVVLMGDTVDVSQLYGLQPLGPLRDKRDVDISAAGYEDKAGFVCQAAKAGDLTYRTVAGDADQTETLEAGGIVQACGVPVLLKAVRASAAIGSVVIGKL